MNDFTGDAYRELLISTLSSEPIYVLQWASLGERKLPHLESYFRHVLKSSNKAETAISLVNFMSDSDLAHLGY